MLTMYPSAAGLYTFRMVCEFYSVGHPIKCNTKKSTVTTCRGEIINNLRCNNSSLILFD